MAAEEIRTEDQLLIPILTADRIRKAVEEADSFKFECSEIAKQVDRISQMLRSTLRIATSNTSVYDRPISRVAAEVAKTLERTLTLTRKCKRRSILRRVVTIINSTDFRKILNLLDASIGDLRWLLSILEFDGSSGGIVLSLPPIASNDPILAWVWSFIASIQMGQLNERIEASNELASLAKDNDRNKTIIIEEGGVTPLLKVFKEAASPDAQLAAAIALFNLANDQERVRVVVNENGVPLIVQVLTDSPIRVQIRVAQLVGRMAEHDPIAQEDFARENVIRPLVSLLSFEEIIDDAKPSTGKPSIHSIVQINKENEKNSLLSLKHHRPHSSSSLSLHHRKEREVEKPELRHLLKVCCAEALWMLSRGSVSNSRRITETKGLLCLAKLIEKEQGDLQINCLMTIMTITASAESNADLRRAAFKTNSPAAKAVVDQLLRIINESNSPKLQIPAIKAIGSLARTFPARETRVIGPLVTQLSHKDIDLATQAAVSLGKFACPENFLCTQHSKAIIEFNGIPPLMRLLRVGDGTQIHALVLLCYLALHAGNSEALEQSRVLNALEGADRAAAVAHNPELRELVNKAIYHLSLYHAGVNPQRQSYPP